MRFSQKTAFITGAGSGIGRATAEAFARLGAHVAMLDIDGASCRQTASNIEAAGGQCLWFEGSIDSASAINSAVTKTMEKWGRLDFLFNNAGMEFIAPLMETSENNWNKVIGTNLTGTYLVTQRVLAEMIKAGCGVIINNASDAGLRGIKLSAAYSASKAAIIHLTRSIALDYASSGIICNCICPGCIRTPLCERFNEQAGARKGISGKEALSQFVAAHVPMQRAGEPEEVASVVLFLCSSEAAYINGAVIPVDGGLTAGM